MVSCHPSWIHNPEHMLSIYLTKFGLVSQFGHLFCGWNVVLNSNLVPKDS
jgi:hypothetical protein